MVWATALIPSLPGTQKSTTVLERVPEIQGTNRTTKTDLCSPLRITRSGTFPFPSVLHSLPSPAFAFANLTLLAIPSLPRPQTIVEKGTWMAMRESRTSSRGRNTVSGRIWRLDSKPQHTTSTRKSTSVGYQTRPQCFPRDRRLDASRRYLTVSRRGRKK